MVSPYSNPPKLLPSHEKKSTFILAFSENAMTLTAPVLSCRHFYYFCSSKPYATNPRFAVTF